MPARSVRYRDPGKHLFQICDEMQRLWHGDLGSPTDPVDHAALPVI